MDKIILKKREKIQTFYLTLKKFSSFLNLCGRKFCVTCTAIGHSFRDNFKLLSFIRQAMDIILRYLRDW